MSKTTAPQTPSPHVKAAEQPAKTDNAKDYKRDFFVAAMNMSWQLAVVVLVPIIGGFELDKKLDTLPALTIAGFFIAMAGMGMVVWRQLQMFSPQTTHKAKGART